VENNIGYSPLNIRFVAKTSDIRNFSQNIRSGNTAQAPCPLIDLFLSHSLPTNFKIRFQPL